ncbi:NgoFVII family restriction endonuclease [Bacillus sp. AFS041924]|uniref:NgoFVII family restriction endonuclease n=1 Tax=Bacillus sp. AFS041924 TaxID=2033503 RepID=UPI000BFD29B6|nr:NgoFVII family restriction endonuclease [Bacillus sp. AFS041924]PGS54239.1 NgoFVII family restriction endonuclease [Bacillus sp. AFS041924]
MEFFRNQPVSQQKEYTELLKLVGSLSNLFADSDVPYLYYRAAENIFCRAFQAVNLSRGDVSADASKNNIGIGLKTFLHNNGKTFQKVAEFNKKNSTYVGNTPTEIVYEIAKLRNKRLEFTKEAHSLDNLMYHLVTRKPEAMYLYEESMPLVKIEDIRGIKKNENTIHFTDGIAEYNFSLSKSTLLKRFITLEPITTIPVEILNDPYGFLLTNREILLSNEKQTLRYPFVYLPLYASSTVGKERQFLEEKSGLNQWNAAPRTKNGPLRHEHEVYIPVPVSLHRLVPDFFPPRDVPFTLELPNGTEISASMCQQASKKEGETHFGKGLMSNPNKALGKWLLQDLLKVPPRKLVTYEMLEEINIDSVILYKKAEDRFSLDFAKVGSFEEYYQSLTSNLST